MSRFAAFLTFDLLVDRWASTFMDLQGISVLGQALGTVTRKGQHRYAKLRLPVHFMNFVYRRETDIQMEYELLKCLKNIFNDEVGLDWKGCQPPSLTICIDHSSPRPDTFVYDSQRLECFELPLRALQA